MATSSRNRWNVGLSFTAIGLVAGLLVGAKPQQQSFTRFQNRWKANEYMHVERGQLESSPIDNGWWSADWIVEPADAGFVRIRNRYRTDFFIHNQNGTAQAGPIDRGWWSAQWAITQDGSGYSRIQNRWKPNEYLNNEKGQIGCSPIDNGWWSAQWKVIGNGVQSAPVVQAPQLPRPIQQAVQQPVQQAVQQAVDQGNAEFDELENFIAPGVDAASDNAMVQWVIAEVGRQEQPVCWKDSYGNGAGYPLNSCPAGMSKEGALCYTPCRPGYRSDGALRCYLDCPAGTSSSPGMCHFKFGSMGGCPKPLTGLKPACVNDNAYGRAAGIPMTCGGGQTQSGALCYPQCQAGHDAAGPVCWKQCEVSHPVNCGAMCGHSTAQCVGTTANMVLSVAMLTANIAGAALTGGTANAGIAAARTAARTGEKVAARAALRGVIASASAKISEKLQARVGSEVLSYAMRRGGQTGEAVAIKYAKAVRLRASKKIAAAALSQEAPDLREIVEMVDPTGVVAVINAFDKPICAPKPMPR